MIEIVNTNFRCHSCESRDNEVKFSAVQGVQKDA